MSEDLNFPIWTALSSRQADMATGNKRAKRYDRKFTTLAGIQDESDESYEALREIVEPGQSVGLCSPALLNPPQGWQLKGSFEVAQMICENLTSCKRHDFVVLGAGDVPAMIELTRLTQPGPFAERTIEFGTFIGIKDGDRLAAMAGERMKVPGFDEVSAVCTHPDYQGRGYARALVYEIAQLIRQRGNIPFLHVKTENLAGIRSYQSIGFRTRRELVFSVLGRPA